MTLCPHIHHQCHCQPQEGRMCPHGAQPTFDMLDRSQPLTDAPVQEWCDYWRDLAADLEDDALRWRFFREHMDGSDTLRMIAEGTDNYDAVCDRLRNAVNG